MLAFAGCLFLLPRPLLADETLTFDAYLALISRAGDRARAAEQQPLAECRAALAAAAAELTAVSRVILPDGATMNVNHDGAAAIATQPGCAAGQFLTYLAGICPPRVCPVQGPPAFPAATGVSAPAAQPLPPTSTAVAGVSPAGSVTQAAAAAATVQAAAGSGGGSGDSAAEGYPAGESGSDAADAYPAGSESGAGGAAPTGEAADPAGAPDGLTGDATGTTAVVNPTATGTLLPSTEATSMTPYPIPPPQLPPTLTAAAADAYPASPETIPNPNRLLQIILPVVLILLIFAFVGLLIYVRRRETAVPQAKKQSPAAETAVAAGRRQLDEGNYREAVRQLFLATLATLEERGLLTYDRARTNRELLHALHAHAAVAQQLRPVVDTFERVWYGFEPVDRAEYDALAQRIDRIERP